MRQNSDEIYDGNVGENDKADNDNSEGDHDGITIKCDFDLSCGGSDVEQLVMLSEKDCKELSDETDDEQEFYGF